MFGVFFVCEVLNKSIFLKAVEYHAEIILNVVIKVKYFIETAFYLLEFYS